MSAIFCFTRDLRLDDHAGLCAAAQHGEVLPVLIVDRRMRARLSASPRRAAFYCAAVAELGAALRERGTQLIVRRAEAGPALRTLARERGADTVAWSAAFDREGAQADRHLQSQLEEAGLRALAVPDAAAISPDEIAAARPSEGEGYRAFVPYYEVWRGIDPSSYDRPLLLSFAQSVPQTEPLPEPREFNAASTEVRAGERAARSRFQRFLDGPILNYSFTRNVPADEGTAHLGADLSFGTIGARTVAREIRKRFEDPFLLTEERASIQQFARSVALRDFFLQLAWHHPHKTDEPLQDRMRDFAFAKTHAALDAWREGSTGFPLVDAGMRELSATGWMHPRVRAIAASFLCFDLGVRWGAGMAHWDSLLIEDEPALALGNWQWIAGVGADLAAYPRIYNPEKQARRFDPNAAYVKRWIPELAHVAPAAIHARATAGPQTELPLFSPVRYPAPVVNHDREARAFLARYRAFRSR